MTTIRSRKRSKGWTPKLLIGLGIIALACILFVTLAPYIIRANRGVIRAEISRIQALPSDQQELAFIKLVRATGADQEVSRALAEKYKSENNYAQAGETYLAARPSLVVNAAASFATAYDFDKVKTLLTQKNIQGSDADALLAQAQLNTNDYRQECKNIQQLAGAELGENLKQACKILDSPNITGEQLYSLVELGAPLQTKRLLDARTQKSNADYLLLAKISMRQGDTRVGQEYIRKGLAATPYDRDFLKGSLELLQDKQGSDKSLIDELDKYLKVLPNQ